VNFAFLKMVILPWLLIWRKDGLGSWQGKVKRVRVRARMRMQARPQAMEAVVRALIRV
jgi:hypothetical protein